MFKRLTTTALVFGMAALAPPLLAPPALAQTLCGPRPVLVGALTSAFGESPEAMGLASPEQIVEIWVAEDTGGWTILLTRPDNLSCVLARGSDWTRLREDGELTALD